MVHGGLRWCWVVTQTAHRVCTGRKLIPELKAKRPAPLASCVGMLQDLAGVARVPAPACVCASGGGWVPVANRGGWCVCQWWTVRGCVPVVDRGGWGPVADSEIQYHISSLGVQRNNDNNSNQNNKKNRLQTTRTKPTNKPTNNQQQQQEPQ